VRWAIDVREKLEQADPEVPEELHDRAADNWRSLLAIADEAGGEWPERSRRAAVDLSASGQDDPSVRVRLLDDLRTLFMAGADKMFSQDIVARLVEMEDRPWPEWKGGKPLTVRQLAKLLEPFGIKPRQIRLGNKSRKGYRLDDCREAFDRYLTDSIRNKRNNPLESAGYGESVSETEGVPVSDAEMPESPGFMRVVSDVSDRKGEEWENGPECPKEVVEL
jgi:putative DNA primase/helicase